MNWHDGVHNMLRNSNQVMAAKSDIKRRTHVHHVQ